MAVSVMLIEVFQSIRNGSRIHDYPVVYLRKPLRL
jgi:hypothetical protein